MDLGGLEGNLGGFLMETHPKKREGVIREHEKERWRKQEPCLKTGEGNTKRASPEIQGKVSRFFFHYVLQV